MELYITWGWAPLFLLDNRPNLLDESFHPFDNYRRMDFTIELFHKLFVGYIDATWTHSTLLCWWCAGRWVPRPRGAVGWTYDPGVRRRPVLLLREVSSVELDFPRLDRHGCRLRPG